MTEEIRRTIIEALHNLRGDDLARAKIAFKRFSSEEMDKQHGASGMTRREILAEYQQHVDRVERAIYFIQEK